MFVNIDKIDEPTLALLCGISKEKGVEHFEIYQKSVNADRFVEYIQALRAANPDDRICLFMDNLSAHTCDKSKKAMREANFRYIFNIPYEPKWNSIEYIFSIVKRNFKNLRAKKFMGLIHDTHEMMVAKSVQMVKK